MTLRKPRPVAAPIAPLPKAIPYPPDSIWRTWEDGKPTLFRGHLFKRQGHQIARVFAPENPSEV
jgi:hypothetical protein